MNTVLWILQVVLALVFLASGSMKVFRYDVARERTRFAQVAPRQLVTFVGAAELLGAVGLVLPAATGILPWLTPLAAAGLVMVMLGASLFHVRLREYSGVLMTTTILLLSMVIVYGRWVAMPF